MSRGSFRYGAVHTCHTPDHPTSLHHHGTGGEAVVHRHPGCPWDCGMAVYERSQPAEQRIDGQAERLTRERDDLAAEVERLRALGDRLAATVSLLLHDAHPVYGSTATWRGGVGGQALTPVCYIIDGPPGSGWAQYDLPSDSLREWVAERGMDAQSLDAAKDRERVRLLALLNPTEGETDE